MRSTSAPTTTADGRAGKYKVGKRDVGVGSDVIGSSGSGTGPGVRGRAAAGERQVDRKIVVLGSQGVGKSSLVVRYVHSRFAENGASTIGASFLAKRVVVGDEGSVVRLQIWDTAGQERFRSMAPMYYRGAHCALLCYDITSRASFLSLQSWVDELRRNMPDDILIHLVGTKRDLVDADPARRQVPLAEAIAYARDHLKIRSHATMPFGAGSTMATNGPSASAAADDEDAGSLTTASRAQSVLSDDVSDYCHEISSKADDPQSSGVGDLFDTVARQLVRDAAGYDERERKRREERRSGARDRSTGSVHIADQSRRRGAAGAGCC